ncbi:hypothetical protein PSHT_14718 [Puccinia striiformis]|uniref:Uncharacterized protein n=1 Tax=Puccinia striiformis TaxID=27350 RepID=A0A2S4UIX8_9BASI|nr:hypothetical protein PSHT_14718 [Puccinia striiformis]
MHRIGQYMYHSSRCTIFLKPCIVASIRYNARYSIGCIGGIGRKLGCFHFGHDLGGGGGHKGQ